MNLKHSLRGSRISSPAIGLMATLLVLACTRLNTKSESAPGHENTALTHKPAVTSVEANLQHAEALKRAQEISNVRYELSLKLGEESERFAGTAKIRFQWRPPEQTSEASTFLDFKDSAMITSLVINGSQASPRFQQHRLYLPVEKLLPAPQENTIEVVYDQVYARDGHGLHRFKDPEDGNVYLYTHFEAFYAHHVFPCFDQPDLKAQLKLEVLAPSKWAVISTTRESLRVASGDKSTWTFPETPRLSTYLFSLHAGPFHKWEARAGAIPLRLFARQSLKKFVHPQDWFKPTSQGLKFFGDYFGLNYPFAKYDQVIVPEFNAGAMENVAAVTFSERFLSRGITTREEREDIAEVILHELAHQWFGNLVTMHWWNGLWLNESFATYMAHLAKVRATEFKDSWQAFALFQKARALIEDQLNTTHPVESEIPDTDSAFANFDAITYGKGAASLKQLSFFIGEDKFRSGLTQYFRKHKYANTTIEDFTGALEKASGIDLKTWTQSWLNTAGVDTLQSEFTCDKGRISHFSLRTMAPTTLRPHRTQIALFKSEMGYLLPYKVVKANYQGANTEITELKGSPCPVLVFPNDSDQDYVKVRLDDASLKTTLANISGVQSAFTRATIWPVLFEAVRDLHLKPGDFLHAAHLGLSKESDTKNIESIARRSVTVLQYLPRTTAAEKAERLTWVEKFEQILWERLSRRNASKDLQLVLLDSFVALSESPEAEKQLVQLLTTRVLPSGLGVDQDRRWEIIVRLNSHGNSTATMLIKNELKVDNSDRAIKMAFAAEAAQPQLESKRSWIQRVVEKNDLSYSQKREVFKYILPPSQDHLRVLLTGNFYEKLPLLAKTKDLILVTLYARTLLPTTCSADLADKLESWLADPQNGAGQLPTPALKTVKNGLQEDQICLRVRKNALEPQ